MPEVVEPDLGEPGPLEEPLERLGKTSPRVSHKPARRIRFSSRRALRWRLRVDTAAPVSVMRQLLALLGV